MIILGIESSCDECAAAVVEKGKKILSNIIYSQVKYHQPFYGVVPEIASRKHLETIEPVVAAAISESGVAVDDLDGLAVTYRPGLIGSLLVGLSYAKGLAMSLKKPFIGIDHILAHLYACHLEYDLSYPHLGLLVSGGHTLIALVRSFEKFEVLGTTIDDACGEAFDKVAKYYDLGFPGGAAIDRLAIKGDARAFNFPKPSLHKGDHLFDVSYSGLKTAVVNQLDQFWNRDYEKSKENIAASFQRIAIDMLVDRVLKASSATGLKMVVAGGGVAANSYLRKRLSEEADLEVIFPSMKLCTDNAAMIAGLGYHFLSRGRESDLNLNAQARVPRFRRSYP